MNRHPASAHKPAKITAYLLRILLRRAFDAAERHARDTEITLVKMPAPRTH